MNLCNAYINSKLVLYKNISNFPLTENANVNNSIYTFLFYSFMT